MGDLMAEDSIIERAARAAYEQGQSEGSAQFTEAWDDPALVNVRETFRRRVRAVLQAIRAPSDAMVCAALDLPPDEGPETYYVTMIDAALKE